MLGDENVDTDEYDQHIVAHEFQHFLEDRISRSESPGGPHSPGDQLDLRVAFSEGFANAFSAMVLDDPVYRDSLGSPQGQGFSFQTSSGARGRRRAGSTRRRCRRSPGTCSTRRSTA